ncbi:MAG: DUF4405 domain-containing protein [Ruminococcus sp.]|jgi:hypothetical protein
MKPKMILKIFADLAMTVLLLLLMAYLLVGESVHEWLGLAMFLLFIFHHLLNRHWHRNLFRGKYTPLRIFQTIVDVLLLAAMIGLMASGIILSREVFSFLPLSGGMGFARTLHMLASYWGFLFMSLHLGLHWNMIMGLVRKAANIRRPSLTRVWILRILAAILCVYGIYAFMKNSIASYMFLQTHFVFFDVDQTLISFFAEYLGMMGLWAVLSYYAGRFLVKCIKGMNK